MNATIQKLKLSSLYGKYHKCKTCGDMYSPDGNFKNCAPCRVAKALTLFNYRLDHKEKGLCVNCVKSAYYDRKKKGKQTRCNYHREYQQTMNFNYYWKNRVKTRYVSNKVRAHG